MDAVAHAECGVVDAGTAGKDASTEEVLGVDAHEATDSGTGCRCTVAVGTVGKKADTIKCTITGMKHLCTVCVHPEVNYYSADTTKSNGLAESVLTAGPLDATADTAEMGNIPKVNGSEASKHPTDPSVCTTRNFALPKTKHDET